MDRTELEERLEAGLRRLMDQDTALLEYDAGERGVAARLACHLAPFFPDHHVDVEYNRHGLGPKSVTLPPECGGGGAHLIVPDIVVHRRGSDDSNLLAVELKKETNTTPRECDRAKLLAMKAEFGYEHGVVLELPAGPGASERQPVLEWV